MSGPSGCACFPFTSLWQLNVQFKDGQAEMSIEAAQKLGICELRDGVEWRSRRYIFGITQFRGVLYVPSSDETVLVARTAKSELSIGFWQKSCLLSFASKVKGNVCIDPALGDKMVLPYTSIKVRKQGRCDDLQYGIDVVRTSDRAMTAMKTPGALSVHIGRQGIQTCVAAAQPEPCLSSIVQALHTLTLSVDSVRHRFVWQELMEEAPEFTKMTLVNRCFRLGRVEPHPNDLTLVQCRTTGSAASARRCCPNHTVPGRGTTLESMLRNAFSVNSSNYRHLWARCSKGFCSFCRGLWGFNFWLDLLRGRVLG